MKNIKIKFFPFILLLFTMSCFNYETQFDGPYKDGENSKADLPKELVYVADGKVYLANKFATDSISIASSDGPVKIASINNDHTKVLFKAVTGNIQVYDIESGSITEEIPNTETAIWFDYHKNNQTIYYVLTNNKLYTKGPEVLVNQPINLRNLSGLFGNVKGVAVLENGDIVFSITSLTSNNKYLFLSDGIDVLKLYLTTSARTNFRLNASEDRLWSGNELNSFLYYYYMPELTQFGDDFDFKIGAPIGSNNGYRITDSNQIVPPNAPLVQSPGGQITSIDY